jgi:hypothetical protein
MRILEITCDVCGAAYSVAESATIEGNASEFSCTVCGGDLIRLETGHYCVCRLVVSAEHAYFHVPRGAPSPVVNA